MLGKLLKLFAGQFEGTDDRPTFDRDGYEGAAACLVLQPDPDGGLELMVYSSNDKHPGWCIGSFDIVGDKFVFTPSHDCDDPNVGTDKSGRIIVSRGE